MELFPLWDAVKLERNPFSEDHSPGLFYFIYLFFGCRLLGTLLTLRWDVCVYFRKSLQQIWKLLGFAYTGEEGALQIIIFICTLASFSC